MPLPAGKVPYLGSPDCFLGTTNPGIRLEVSGPGEREAGASLVRAILIMGISALLFPWASAHADSRLAEIFCRTLLAAQNPLDLDWTTLSREMETLSPPSTVQDAALLECQTLYGPQFEEAEFILGGKRLLEGEIEAAKAAPNFPAVEMSGEFETDLTGKMLLPAEQGTAGVSLSELQARHRGYAEQWDGFLVKLKNWFKGPRTSAQVVQSPTEIR